jgi:hypothetical protein
MRAKTAEIDVAAAARMLGKWSDPSSYFAVDAFREPCFPNLEAARAAWRVCRRAVWSTHPRFTVPVSATKFDQLTMDSPAAVRAGWPAAVVPLENILATLARDRASLGAFMRDDVRGAASIADFLEMLRHDLNTVERTARTMSATIISDRPYPHDVSTAERYGDVH